MRSGCTSSGSGRAPRTRNRLPTATSPFGSRVRVPQSASAKASRSSTPPRVSTIDVETSCREGTCASCETSVLEGEVCHRDSVLSAGEREQSASIMLCVSRARSDLLVLDL
ncbi:2Fe-2S iron-sulfur cluster-binding protein [Rhodococcus opacus]|uniref:2Fe-2S iron-sulfur cluster-binding protein n=1 Tax=Rhodococcus opacus TaxID=37919 RepID=UPI0009B5C53C